MRYGDLHVKLFVDTADLKQVDKYCQQSWVQGYTTNPTIMRKAGVGDYKTFALDFIKRIGQLTPVSFEVVADDFANIERQAREIASWAKVGQLGNVYVKIPITTTRGHSCVPLIRSLSAIGVKINVTAVFTRHQVEELADALAFRTPSIISIFAGRIADTGRPPDKEVMYAKRVLSNKLRTNVQVLWASPRQVLDIYNANTAGADIITVTPELLAKLDLVDKDLEEYSRETVKMFFTDAQAAGYAL